MVKLSARWTRLASSEDHRLDIIELSYGQGRQDISNPSTPLLPLKHLQKRPPPRVGVATAALKAELYLVSGRGGPAMVPIEEKGAVWHYTPNQGIWSFIKPADPSAPYPASCSNHAMASDGNKSIYSEQGGAMDVLDLATHAWSTISFTPDGVHGPERRSVSALLEVKVKGRDFPVTLFGERDPSSLGHAGAGKMLADVWAFDLDCERWTRIEPMGDAPLPRGWSGADVTIGDDGAHAVIIHGGFAEDNSGLSDVWKLQFD
ncbi:hypothetical protein B0T21DRAFT_388152 [Apiosordaria backusii]|uniref:Uncharacterized protein n=1 Tax=Apiosordaria backusii TaxID=314023 RepID=A0AA40DGP7_9PEZI|nr:hypothetical protein B0T21DRAFT_388152 [Apiosordaria backusii]